MERVLPAEDRAILTVGNELALTYMNAGRYHEAVSEYTQLLADYERVMGPRHNMTLMVRGELGEAYLKAVRIAEGTEMKEAAAAGRRAVVDYGFLEARRVRVVAIDEAQGQ